MTVIVPVILAGGEGARLWPLSTPACPKHFLALANDGKTLFQQTVERAQLLAPETPSVVVTLDSYQQDLQAQLEAIGVSQKIHFLIESYRRNTAFAVLMAALYVQSQWKDAVLAVMPSDHAITDIHAWLADMQKAVPVAEQGQWVLFGVPPKQADSRYGYVVCGDETDTGGYRVAQFCEKPEPEVAEALIRQGNSYWNSGMFVFTPSMLCQEMQRIHPSLFGLAQHVFLCREEKERECRLPSSLATSFPSLPIDRAVLEQSSRLRLIPASFDWLDVGSWEGLWKALPKDAAGNAIIGSGELKNSRNTLIYTDGFPVSCDGVEGLVVVVREGKIHITTSGLPVSESDVKPAGFPVKSS